MDGISDNNPSLEEMKERGWAWLQRSRTSRGGYRYGAPYTDDEMASENVKRLHPFDEDRGIKNTSLDKVEQEAIPSPQDLIIVSWEEKRVQNMHPEAEEYIDGYCPNTSCNGRLEETEVTEEDKERRGDNLVTKLECSGCSHTRFFYT